MRLTESIRQRLAGKKILLMAHLVLGYPSFEANRETVRQMVEAGVDLIELQIPFSEPMADGPVIALANQEALARGTTVRQCLDFARETVAAHPIPFLFMTYCNIVIQHGLEAFCRTSADMGIQGFIVPDLPPEEGGDYLDLCARHEIAPILIYAPTSTDERMRVLASHARGLIYCVARRGSPGPRPPLARNSTATWNAAGRRQACRWRWGSVSGSEATWMPWWARRRSRWWEARRSVWWTPRGSRRWDPSCADFGKSRPGLNDSRRRSGLSRPRTGPPQSGQGYAAGKAGTDSSSSASNSSSTDSSSSSSRFRK